MKTQAAKSTGAARTSRQHWIQGVLWLAIGAGVIAVTIIAVVFYWSHNYAEDAVRSFEASLIKSGAVKVCSTSSPGRGPDSLIPTYNAYYQFGMGKSETTQAVKNAARDAGFSLSAQKSDYSYVDMWADSSKQSTYPGFDNGGIQLSVAVTGEGSTKPLTCTVDGKTSRALTADSSHTVVSIGIMLPDGASR